MDSDGIVSLLTEWKNIFVLWAMCMPRMLAAFALIPFLGRNVVPRLIRIPIVASFTVILLPFMMENADKIQFNLLILLKEVLLGTMVGYGIASVFWAVEAAGSFIDNQRGASMSSTLNPMTNSDSLPLGIFLLNTIAWVFFASGGFLTILLIFITSYKFWPLWSFVPIINPQIVPLFLDVLDKMMYMALMLASPIILTMFFSELGLALANRFAPQLQVFFLAMPIKSGVAFFILIPYMIFFVDYAWEALEAIPSFIQTLYQKWK